MTPEFPLLTKQQFEEIERQLVAAEAEAWGQMHKSSIEITPAIADLQFKSLEYIRRLVEDHKRLTEALEKIASLNCDPNNDLSLADAELGRKQTGEIARFVLVEDDAEPLAKETTMKPWIVQTQHGVEQFDSREYAVMFADRNGGTLFARARDQVGDAERLAIWEEAHKRSWFLRGTQYKSDELDE